VSNLGPACRMWPSKRSSSARIGVGSGLEGLMWDSQSSARVGLLRSSAVMNIAPSHLSLDTRVSSMTRAASGGGATGGAMAES